MHAFFGGLPPPLRGQGEADGNALRPGHRAAIEVGSAPRQRSEAPPTPYKRGDSGGRLEVTFRHKQSNGRLCKQILRHAKTIDAKYSFNKTYAIRPAAGRVCATESGSLPFWQQTEDRGAWETRVAWRGSRYPAARNAAIALQAFRVWSALVRWPREGVRCCRDRGRRLGGRIHLVPVSGFEYLYAARAFPALGVRMHTAAVAAQAPGRTGAHWYSSDPPFPNSYRLQNEPHGSRLHVRSLLLPTCLGAGCAGALGIGR